MFSKRYLKAGGDPGIWNKSRQEKSEVALWQRRYWEHTIKDGKDFVQHVDYINVNPVKHGYASKPGNWEWSGYQRYLKQIECWVQKTNPTYMLLVKNKDSSEWNIHKSLENNLWIISNQLTLYKSNKTVKRTVEEYTNKKYSGNRAKKRPDLILLNNINQDYLLIELKRYYHDLKLDDAIQALQYGIDLRPHFGDMKEILVIGGKLPKNVNKNDIPQNVTLETYDRIIGKARSEIDWLLNEFTDIRNL